MFYLDLDLLLLGDLDLLRGDSDLLLGDILRFLGDLLRLLGEGVLLLAGDLVRFLGDGALLGDFEFRLGETERLLDEDDLLLLTGDLLIGGLLLGEDDDLLLLGGDLLRGEGDDLLLGRLFLGDGEDRLLGDLFLGEIDDLLGGDLLGDGDDLFLFGGDNLLEIVLGEGEDRLLGDLFLWDGEILLGGDLFLGDGDDFLLGEIRLLGGVSEPFLEDDFLDDLLADNFEGEGVLDLLITRLMVGDVDLFLGVLLRDLDELSDLCLVAGEADFLTTFLGVSFFKTGGSVKSCNLLSKALFPVSAFELVFFRLESLDFTGIGICSVITWLNTFS